MGAPIALKYEDEEGLVVKVRPTEGHPSPPLAIEVLRSDQELAVVYAHTIKSAQAIARLLVGNEIQSDGAAWKRGPRPPAQPTDDKGKRKRIAVFI